MGRDTKLTVACPCTLFWGTLQRECLDYHCEPMGVAEMQEIIELCLNVVSTDTKIPDGKTTSGILFIFIL